MASVYDFRAVDLQGHERSLNDYRGQALLIVNVASKCGFTPQYTALESLHRRLKDRSFSVLGFPCNQFMSQEPGNAGEIESFCKLNYDVSFPLFAKISVNGKDAHPLYRYLKKEARGVLGSSSIKWNFTKFLVDRTGRVRKRYGPSQDPAGIENDIVTLLG
jgi:glutathione peroxidase